MKIFKRTSLYLSISIFALYSVSCVNIKTTGKAAKYVETFYVQEGNTQYFIKPLYYKSEESNELLVDFTLRDSTKQPPVRMLFTINSEKGIRGHSECSVKIREDQKHSAKKIYAKPVKKGYNYRYEAIVPYNDFVLIIRENEDIFVNIGESIMQFKARGKTEKALNYIDSAVIQMLEMQ
jgi:hypothetical protein